MFLFNTPENALTNSNQNPVVATPDSENINSGITTDTFLTNKTPQSLYKSQSNQNNIYPIHENDLVTTSAEKQYKDEKAFFNFKHNATKETTKEYNREKSLAYTANPRKNDPAVLKQNKTQSQDRYNKEGSEKNEENTPYSITGSKMEGSEHNNIEAENEGNEETKSEEETTEASNDSIKKPVKKEPKENTQEKNSKKWSVSLTGGYVIYTPFNKNSLIDTNLNNNSREGKFTFSYGATLNFQFLENLRFSVGANKNLLSYSTANVPSSNENERDRILNYLALNASSNINSSLFADFINDDADISLIHEIEYLEIPIHLTYKLTSGRLGFHMIGGVSMNFVSGNEVFAQNSGNELIKLGSINTLINGNISLNLGAGVYYDISDKFSIEVNPSFKYSLSKYNNRNGSDKPNLLGVYTVLTYRLW